MELNEFFKKHAGKPMVLRAEKRQGHPAVMINRPQEAYLASLIMKGIPYDDMCEQALGGMIPLEGLTAEEAVLVIERGNYLYKLKKDDRHRRTFGSEPARRPISEPVKAPTHIAGWQKNAIRQLIDEGVAYGDMLMAAINEVRDINRLTFREAIRVVNAGTKMKEADGRLHETS